MQRNSPEGYLKQLSSYIIKNLQKGYTQESLKWALINQGYPRLEVEKAIKLANEQLSFQAPKMIEKPAIKVELESISQSQDAQAKKSLWQKFKEIF